MGHLPGGCPGATFQPPRRLGARRRRSTHAYNAWTLFRGQPSVTGAAVPNVGALMLLLEGAGVLSLWQLRRRGPPSSGFDRPGARRLAVHVAPLAGRPGRARYRRADGDLADARLFLTRRVAGDRGGGAGSGGHGLSGPSRHERTCWTALMARQSRSASSPAPPSPPRRAPLPSP